MEITKGYKETLRMLLRLAMLESCKPIQNDTQIVKHIKLAIAKDAMMESILAFFYE